jgi:hypothetical protein
MFSRNTEISNFMKIRPVEAKLFRADRRTDMTKLIIAFAILRTRLKVFIKALRGEARREMCNESSSNIFFYIIFISVYIFIYIYIYIYYVGYILHYEA